MANTGKKVLIGCGGGCGCLILVVILTSVISAYLIGKPYEKAVELQNELTEVYGSREDYKPTAKGITPDRLEAFLVVRDSLAALCIEFQELGSSFEAMDELDKDEEPSKKEVFKGISGMLGSVADLAGNMGEMARHRNEVLLDQDMGLGEYCWIYVLAYYSYLGFEAGTDFDGTEGTGLSAEMGRLVLHWTERQAESLELFGDPMAAVWRDEAERLQRSDDDIPFAGRELPENVTSLFDMYRTQLEASFCAAMDDFELGEITKQGMSFHSD